MTDTGELRVFGIKTGLAVVVEPAKAEPCASLRAFTFDGQANVTVTVVDLTLSETWTLCERLAEVVGARVEAKP